jgi:hypothetical protein
MAPLLARSRLAGRLLGTARALSAATSTPASTQLAAIKALREASGAPMGDVKAALVEAGWDADGAFAALRKKGLAAAQKKVCQKERDASVGELEQGKWVVGGEARGDGERETAPARSRWANLAVAPPSLPDPPRASLTPRSILRPPATPLRAWSACPSPGSGAPWSR